MKISMNKKYTTRDGREVRIYAVDGRVGESVHGAVCNQTGWSPYSWFPEGSYYNGKVSPLDLVEKPQTVRVQGYVNVYPTGIGALYEHKKDANYAAGPDRVACIKIDMEVEHGRFDD